MHLPCDPNKHGPPELALAEHVELFGSLCVDGQEVQLAEPFHLPAAVVVLLALGLLARARRRGRR